MAITNTLPPETETEKPYLLHRSWSRTANRPGNLTEDMASVTVAGPCGILTRLPRRRKMRHGGGVAAKGSFLLLGQYSRFHLWLQVKKSRTRLVRLRNIYFFPRYRSTGTVTTVAMAQQVMASNRPWAPTMAMTRVRGLEAPFAAAVSWMYWVL